MASSPNIPPSQGGPTPHDDAITISGRAYTLRVDPAVLRFTFVRSSGPGGQSVNKVNTRAQLRVFLDDIDGLQPPARARLRRLAGHRLVGGSEEDSGEEIFIQADTHRSQLSNRRECITRLRLLLEKTANPPRRRKRRRITAAMKQKRLDRKRQQAEKKQRRRRVRPDRDS